MQWLKQANQLMMSMMIFLNIGCYSLETVGNKVRLSRSSTNSSLISRTPTAMGTKKKKVNREESELFLGIYSLLRGRGYSNIIHRFSRDYYDEGWLECPSQITVKKEGDGDDMVIVVDSVSLPTESDEPIFYISFQNRPDHAEYKKEIAFPRINKNSRKAGKYGDGKRKTTLYRNLEDNTLRLEFVESLKYKTTVPGIYWNSSATVDKNSREYILTLQNDSNIMDLYIYLSGDNVDPGVYWELACRYQK